MNKNKEYDITIGKTLVFLSSSSKISNISLIVKIKLVKELFWKVIKYKSVIKVFIDFLNCEKTYFNEWSLKKKTFKKINKIPTVINYNSTYIKQVKNA